MACHRCNFVDTITSSTTQDIENSETKSPESETPVWSSRLSSYQSRIKVAVLKKNCISPYTKKARKTEEKQRMLLLSPKSNTSSVVSKRSEIQDSSSHQMRSVQSSDRISKLASYKSSTTNNFFFLSRSKRNRPVSAPPGQLRCPMLPHSKFHLAQKASEVPHIFKRQPEILRVTAYKNGTINTFVKVAVPPSIRMLLEECTEKLKLNMAARRVFLADGTEALDAIDIPHDADVYISTGEPFSNPFKKIKDHLVLMKNATWTLNGVVLPGDVKKRKAKLLLSKHIKNLSEKPTVRLLVFKNCMGQDGSEITAPLGQTEKFLDACTMRLNLTSPAKYLYNMHGEKVEDLSSVPLLDKCLQNSITPLHGPLWVSKGEGFSPSGAKMYIQGVLLALHQQLKSAKNYYEQLDSAMDGQKEKITIKGILSLKKEELWDEQDEVNKLIDELQAAIKNYKGHLSELAPQLQAEQEQCAAYVYQHIKELPASTALAQSLQLKVYENGKDSGEILVYINRKEIESNSGNQPSAMLEKVLHTIHQRLQHSADFKPSGLSHFPTRLFDETGQEIKNPLLLQNEQKIWVSYGEDYRSPLNPVLSLTYDRVTAAEKHGVTIIYKTLLDHTVDLLPGCDNWKICAGFPENFQVSKNLEPGSETVSVDNHFVQYKADPQMVLFMSVTMENLRKASPRRNYQQDVISSSSLWPFSSVWLITKTGMILSRAVAQSTLALGHPIRVVTQDGICMEGYKLSLQKRDKTNIYQYWEFGNDGSIHSKAYPEFVLTYLEDLNVKEVTQMEYHTYHAAQSASLRSSPRQFLQNNVRDYDVKQLSRPLDADLVPEGPLEENRQLTVALVRKLEEKHPKASAQRWAIKHEGTSKPGQWKQSKVNNPLWNKLTLMWPVLPSGELNEDFAWPIEGFLIPNSPPLKKPTCKKADSYMAVRLKVLRNGELDKTKAVTILGSDYATRMKKPNAEPEKKQKEKKVQKMCVDGNSEKEIHRTEFQHFLERCTMLLNLPFAARRLFTEKGVEILLLKDLERDQLVYVSCGEQWLDPQVTMAQHKKRLQLSNLAADITTVSAFCVMRNPKNLVLEVKSDITVGAKLFVEKARVEVEGEKVVEEPEEKQAEEKSEKTKDEAHKCLNSHEKSHLRSDEWLTTTKYPWQHNSHDFDEYCNLEKESFFENAELYQKYRHQPKLTEEIQKAHHQQFEFRNGKIINCSFPNLVLGVKNSDIHPGTEVILLEKKCGDITQHWIWKECSRTFHLVADTNLVLAVSMPKILNGSPRTSLEMQGCAVLVQKYKEYINGAANQKWNYTDTAKTFSAFCSTILDQEITAANHASICTFSVTNREKIDQPGYSFLSPGGKQKVMICLACARTMRGKKELEKLIPGTLFFCASGSEEGNHLCISPFKCLNVKKTDLSTSEAEGTLHYLEDVLASLRTETSSQIISEKMSAVVNQKAVKIMAYKNGAGYKNGQLIIASTFPMLLSLCTRRLELNRPACKLYNSEGTLILTLHDLVLYAVNDYYRKQKSEEKVEKTHFIPGPDEDPPELSTEDNQSEEMYSNSKSSVMTLDLNMIDDSLLNTILKTPIEVWVSSGESFMSLNSVEIAERQDKQNWLEKDKILADLDAMKHKMRQLQGRRMSKHKAANLVPTKSPHQPVVVEGGWTEETPEEMKLMEEIQHLEMHLTELQALQMKRSSPFSPKLLVKNHRDLYNQPTTKRLWVYPNGHRPKQGTHAWGKTIEELLDSCTTQLKLPQPAKALYTSDGEQLQSWDEIERDMIVCVSTGPPFLSRKAAKHEMEVRALYSRIRKQQGPEATNIVVVPSEKTTGQVTSSNCLMALPWKNDQQSSD